MQGSDGDFYGGTYGGGASSHGTIFKMTPSGTLTTLFNFTGANGASSNGLIQGSDGNFYGTTYDGGTDDDGTVFGLFGPPATYGASAATTENMPVSFTVAFDDPCGKGIASVAFPTPPAHGSLAVGAITETGTTGTVGLTYTPSVGYYGADSFTYTVTSSTVGTSTPQTVTLTIAGSPTVPTIASFAPSSGPVGTVVTITGTNLNGVTAVRFHNASAKVFAANASGTQMTVTVPSGAATGTITVTTPGGSVKSAQAFTVTTVAAPTITSFTPVSGPIGTVVTLTGTNLGGTSAVRFHDASAKTFAVNGAGTQLTVTVPSSAATGTITVTTPGGSVKTAKPFTVTGT